jgi:hypothetical protein
MVAVGDLAAGANVRVTVEYQVEKPCESGCSFETLLSVDLPDALDVSGVQSKTVLVRVPVSK